MHTRPNKNREYTPLPNRLAHDRGCDRRTCTEVVNPYLVLFLDPIANIIGQDQLVKIPTLCAFAVILLGWPQVAFGLVGGYLSQRFMALSFITRR